MSAHPMEASLARPHALAPQRPPVAAPLWSMAGAAGSTLLPFALFAVFARLVAPEQIAEVAVCLALTEILKTLCPQGLYETLLSRSTTRELERAAAGMLLLTSGMWALVYAVVVIAWVVPGEPLGLRLALATLGVRIVFDNAVLQPQAAMARDLKLRSLALRSTIASGLAGLVGVAALALGEGVLAIVIYNLTLSITVLTLTLAASAQAVRPSMELSSLRPIWPQALFASVVRAMGGLNSYLDQVLVRLFLPAGVVAGFSLAKRVEVTIVGAASVFSMSLFQPRFATSDDDHRRQANLHWDLSVVTVLFATPVIAFLCVRQDLIALVFGEHWRSFADVVALLAVSALARSYGGIHSAALSVTGRNHLVFRYALVSALSGFGVLLAAAPFGPLAVAAALAVKNWACLALVAAMSRPVCGPMLAPYAIRVVAPIAVLLCGGMLLQRLVAEVLPTMPTALANAVAAPLLALLLLTAALVMAAMASRLPRARSAP